MKRELLERIELLGDRLPANPLDQLIDDLGGTDNVAEVYFKFYKTLLGEIDQVGHKLACYYGSQSYWNI